jgi:hypothetical protein
MPKLTKKDHKTIASKIVADFVKEVLRNPDIDPESAAREMVKEADTEIKLRRGLR